MKKIIKKFLSPLFRSYDIRLEKNKQEIDTLYRLLYNQVHDLEHTIPLVAAQTVGAFSFQWSNLSEGEAMLSDKRFKDDVERIITEKEILIKKEWFKGKEVMDCGCGGGRWSYGLAKLGANVTAVDINESALEETRNALKEFSVAKQFILTPLEELTQHVPAGKKYDLVWCWGGLHHCNSFNEAFRQVMSCVKEGGFIYLYLYGRESVSYEADISLFKNRVIYNTIDTWEAKEKFLLDKSKGNRIKLHQNHDIYAPLLNRRLEFDQVKKMLEENGFTEVVRTVKDTELYIRAVKTSVNPGDKEMLIKSENNTHWSLKLDI